MLMKIDVYSVGILLPSLFLTKSNINFPFRSSELILDFYRLFEKMSEPYYENRISAVDSYNEYLLLIKKYSNKNNNKNNNNNKKNSKKRTKKKKRK